MFQNQSHSFLLSLLLPLFFCFVKSNANDDAPSYAYCPKFNCNGVEVSYPFWRLDNYNATAPQYCGYPGFGINCSVSHSQPFPILHLPGDDFYVRNIDYETNSLTLVDIDVFDVPCPRARHNLTLEKLPLEYSDSDLKLTFYFNCTKSLPQAYPAECLIKSGGKASYFYVGEISEPEDLNWFRVCEEKVVATVTERGRFQNDDWIGGFGGAMGECFVLDWRSASECGKCEDSHGRCGFNNSTQNLLCFCKDGTVKFDHCKGNKRDIRVKAAVGASATALTAFVACVIFFLYRRQKKSDAGSSLISSSILSYPSSITDPEKASHYFGIHVFDYNELQEATSNFDSKKELGEGGFGTVYKGKLRDGRVVAVKRLYENNYKRVEQFRNEVELLTRLHHRNLVTLYGCTSRHSRELLLVYEYIPNGTVADHLHGEHTKPGSLSWITRMSIAIETASALAYLHNSDVIHRDVKTNNILLDNNFCVKVADFGLSRLFPTDATHVSTAPQGTPGYVDPQYHECYQLTSKSDVYSFGVVLIELISSLPAVDISRHRYEINLSNMAINKIQSNALHELVDPSLGFDSNEKVKLMITAVAELAFQCLQNDRDLRPSMQEVLKSLLGIQSMDKTAGETDQKASPGDDSGLLKNNALSLSPDSVIAKWTSSSRSRTSNSSTG
ncbi:PREDICTED: LEAF RUST 10 DISEASE-RESISTANCE LOCUS RECEPTOR-LIKE PROTEIN KINASE-like 1.2 isoform X2 [Nicotiana attenuata]|uniref:LEAF RUST 10 DISEASE-RESISTANCE LOCUS RECEPTOR-LIKE PROTEIN KINASE-like 1.2 isoform X2 n=1 Tax=Nicotiana attenuata TaxID=49451 RepID=UPI00090539CB|nr:PREDICTED: LEAF RUST 10 DISEASE-RESISTANCE LOCUS RECEPTOR-LIKE PROTEIN KINASE-like 1.2 isoform X2 [Nicotiana attenuata]